MRIAVAQISTRAGDVAATCERIAQQARLAAEKDVDLLVFPLPALCGPAAVGSADREGFVADLIAGMTRLAGEVACPCLVPVPLDFGGHPASEAILIEDGDVTPVVMTTALEARAASDNASGDSLPELPFHGARLGVAFTYADLDTYDDYDYDVDVIVFLSGYGFAVDDPSSALGAALAEGRFRNDAETTGAWIVGVGGVGYYDEQVFCGSSFVLSPWGELAAQAPAFEEALLVCDVDPSAEGPLAAPLTPEVYDAPLATWGALTLGLSGLVEQAGAQGVCVLVGDDLPSQLALTLAVEALGPTHVHALVPSDAASALALTRALRLPPANVDAYDAPDVSDAELAADLAEVRLAEKARRTLCLPLSPADKTGRALERSRGVSVVAVEPFGDLYRSDVVSLARMRNTISPVIAPDAFARVAVPDIEGLSGEFPSAEARLSFVDLVLTSYVEWECSLTEIAADRGHAKAVEAIARRLRDVEPLRADVATSLVVSSRALDEARLPTGLAWRDRVRSDAETLEGLLARALVDAAQPEKGEPRKDKASAADSRQGERDIVDLLGYVRDFSMGGAFSPFDPSHLAGREDSDGTDDDSAAGGGLWDGPFSEN